jgi:hypothetical protein
MGDLKSLMNWHACLLPALCLLNSENVARPFPAQLICCAPKPCNVEIALVRADYHEIGLALSQESEDRSDFTTLSDVVDRDIEITLLGLYLLEESVDLSVVCVIASNGDAHTSQFRDGLRDFIDSS